MKFGIFAASFTGLAALSAGGLALSWEWSSDPVPPELAAASAWSPPALQAPRVLETAFPAQGQPGIERIPEFKPLPLLQEIAASDNALPEIEPVLTRWSREIAPGETLDAVLAEAGLAANTRAEVALAIGAEYDLRRLRPGHSITLISNADGAARSVSLTVGDGVRIEATFGEELSTSVVSPEPELVTLAGKAVIGSSLFAALEEAEMPARFAVDLAQMLGGTVDFRRDMSGGEKLQLLWREARLGNERIGQPDLAFAALEIGGALYEIVWPDNGSGQATIYVDGEVLRVFAQPVEGARLSSVFGRRTHPIYGNVRMHTGVDFAAAGGTPVHATAPGQVSFIGWRNGYGRVVELTHGSDTMTRYAHLSSTPDELAQGQRVAAGDMIGRVGATGTATGPNLHYEVLVEGRPTDPLSDDRLANAIERQTDDDISALSRLAEARARLATSLDREIARQATESL
ncbi:M23 family metallopeptidase [Rhodobacteraceae bacterium F11138]|nr:M23 family metallopeptidase [Rhodobacteraceae bacterium F11138]